MLHSLNVGSEALAAGGSDNIDKSTVVLDSLLGTATCSLLLLLGLHLGGLVFNLTGTSQRSVDLAAASKAKHQVQGRFLLDVVVTVLAEEREGRKEN